MDSRKKKIVFCCVNLLLIFVFFTGIVYFRSKNNIEYVLKSVDYSYLPLEAQNYIKEVYEKTGEIILTEKNKEKNKVYLNPEYIEYLTLSDEEKNEVGEIPVSMIVDYSIRDIYESVDIPSKYDLRNVDSNNYVTPVRDQGKLGVCWTFATAGVVESYILKNDNTISSRSPKLISERQIDYVTSRNGIKDYKSEYMSFISRSLGDGGNFYISTIAMANGVSLFDYNSFKEYNDTDMSKMELSDVINYQKSEYEVNSTINMPRMNLRESTSILTEKEIETRDNYLKEVKMNIMENGSAYVGTYMNSSCQYTDVNLNNLVIDVYNCSTSGGHAMQIIGWDDNLEYAYCADTKSHKADTSNCNNVIKGKGVWILKNSWGEELQYPYLTYDSLYSSIFFIDEMVSGSNKSWDNNYVLGTGVENIGEKTYYLKDTKIKGNEKIEKIKFIADISDAIYNVKIYQKDGTSSKTFSKTTRLPGLITIEITDDIVVDKDTRIVISSESSYTDKVSIFTSNIDKVPYIDLSKYENTVISDFQMRLYSETKNILSGTNLIYKLYDLDNKEVTDGVSFSNNIVAENNVNTLVEFSNDLSVGDYTINVFYNNNKIASTNIKFTKMEGNGTKDDPYIITNSTQLSQIRNDLDGYYELANDIDLTEDTREGGKLSLESSVCPQGFGWESINDFNGTLDGKGHTIRGLYQNNYLECNVELEKWHEYYNAGNGLFGNAYGNVTIKNLVLEDFEVNCSGRNNDYCSALLSNYNASDADYNDKNEYNAIFENIVFRNSSTRRVSNRTSYGGGLFGNLQSLYGNISISNIYLDFKLESSGFKNNAYLLSYVAAKGLNIQNIQLKGNIIGKYDDGSGDSVLVDTIFDYSDLDENVSIKNILSTVTGKNVTGILFEQGIDSIIDSVNVLSIEGRPLCERNCLNTKNVNIYNKDTELHKLTDKNNYSTWEGFDNNWVIKTIDGIPRIPVLKFVDFEYTKINDIHIKQKLNEQKSIYDYIMPNIDAAKRISYKSNNEKIVKIDENGIIIPQATGSTTIHIESYYDGYIKDVPITIEYIPHYTIHFDSNDTEKYYGDIEGIMESFEVEAGKSTILPANKFTQEYYEFKEWNTKADGTGMSYSDLSEIPAMSDKEEITLYVQWWGKERVVNFDANGGTVTPERKIVRIHSEYGELPIPTRSGYGFRYWDGIGSSISVYAFARLNALELAAVWETDAYTIIYDANGGIFQEDKKDNNSVYEISESLATTSVKNGHDEVIHDNLYEKVGYKFKEWNAKSDGTGTSYAVNQTIQLSNVQNDILRLYAIWVPETYELTFNANGGTGKIDKQIFTYDISQKITKNVYTKEGYKFKEWNTKADGTGISYVDEKEVKISKNLTIYAIWVPETYELTFNANGGTGKMDKQIFTYDISQKITKNVYTKEGYKFKEWNTKADGTGISYVDEKEIKISKNLTIYAIWEEDIIYIINKYSVDDSKKYIDKIAVNTTFEDFSKNIKLNVDYGIVVDYKTVNEKNILYTGGKTKIYKGTTLMIEYSNIIRGDNNGDGAINSADLLKLRQHLLEIQTLKDVYFVASDVNYDDVLNSADIFRIRQHLLKIKNIEY